jgi:hypothetical protein
MIIIGLIAGSMREGYLVSLVFFSIYTVFTLSYSLLKNARPGRFFQFFKTTISATIFVITFVIYWIIYLIASGGDFSLNGLSVALGLT